MVFVNHKNLDKFSVDKLFFLFKDDQKFVSLDPLRASSDNSVQNVLVPKAFRFAEPKSCKSQRFDKVQRRVFVRKFSEKISLDNSGNFRCSCVISPTQDFLKAPA